MEGREREREGTAGGGEHSDSKFSIRNRLISTVFLITIASPRHGCPPSSTVLREWNTLLLLLHVSLSPSHTRCSSITSVCVCVCVCRTSSSPLLYSHRESSFSSVEEPAPLLLWCGVRAISWCDFSFGPISALRDLSFPKSFGNSFPLFTLR